MNHNELVKPKQIIYYIIKLDLQEDFIQNPREQQEKKRRKNYQKAKCKTKEKEKQ